MGHVLYEMRTMKVVCGIGTIQPGRATIVKHLGGTSIAGWGQTCARHVYDAWTTEGILGIQKKFRG